MFPSGNRVNINMHRPCSCIHSCTFLHNGGFPKVIATPMYPRAPEIVRCVSPDEFYNYYSKNQQASYRFHEPTSFKVHSPRCSRLILKKKPWQAPDRNTFLERIIKIETQIKRCTDLRGFVRLDDKTMAELAKIIDIYLCIKPKPPVEPVIRPNIFSHPVQHEHIAPMFIYGNHDEAPPSPEFSDIETLLRT